MLRSSAPNEGEDRFRVLVDNSPDAIFVEDEKGVVLDVNPAACCLHKLSRNQLVGRNVLDLVPPEKRAQVQSEFRRWFTGELQSCEGLSYAADGQAIAVDILSSRILYDGRQAVLLQVRDISRRKRAEDRLAQLNRCFLNFGGDPDENIRRLVELCGSQMGATAALYNRQEGALLCSLGHWQAPEGYCPVDTAEGHVCFDVIRNNSGIPLVVRDLQSTSYATSDRNVRSYGLRTYVGVAVRWNREAIGSLCVVYDRDVEPTSEDLDFIGIVASGVAVEEERKRNSAAHQRMEERIRQTQKLESLGMLAGGVAHDFNNLLMSMLGNADLALESLPPDVPERPFIENVKKSAGRAAELTAQMLAYAGKKQVAREEFDLNGLVQEMTQLLKVSISKKATLRLELSSAMSGMEGDPGQIRQVVMNLLINASDAIGDCSGTIVLSTGEIRADRGFFDDAYFQEEFPPGPYIYVRVADSGCGFDEGTRARLFDPFFSTKFVGRGLGLPVVMGIVRSHRGAIKVESRPGQGSVFTVFFPAYSGVPCEGAKAPAGLRASGSDRPVLVVDDEEDVLAVVGNMLRQGEHRVMTAGSGRQALQMLGDGSEKPAVVLLDLTMPDMDGVQVLSAIRKSNPALPVIVSSGFDEADVAMRFGALQYDGFIQKPYEIRTLLEKVSCVSSQTAGTQAVQFAKQV
jgi:PAS domain S-box-containing protein